MRLNDESMQTARTDTQIALVRAVVREEIMTALTALGRAADQSDVDYETSEIESRAYQAGRAVAERAVSNLSVCWGEKGHDFTDWYGNTLEACTNCGTPNPNPFEENSRG